MKKFRNTIPDRVSKGYISVPDRLRVLNKTQPHAVLATDSDGQPYTSLIAYALTTDIKGVIFITPKSTRKYKNILKNKKVALLIDTRSNTTRDYMSAECVTILGKAYPVRKGKKRTEFSEIFLKKHPKFREIIDSPETVLVLIKIIKGIHVTRFQSVSVWEMK
jgi:nitroimidazol reductase NimA-like FMN-containing flavoprotein (pyridoxamine 5'-phosphate oxidase superfamily)